MRFPSVELAGWHADWEPLPGSETSSSRSSGEAVVLTLTTTPEPLKLKLPTELVNFASPKHLRPLAQGSLLVSEKLKLKEVEEAHGAWMQSMKKQQRQRKARRPEVAAAIVGATSKERLTRKKGNRSIILAWRRKCS
jgi:hypothetical protein